MQKTVLNHIKHKVFVCYSHEDDKKYKDYIDLYLLQQSCNLSMSQANTGNASDYIKELIRKQHIDDTTVVVVLVGTTTRLKNYIDWEIFAGLSASTKGSAGLLAIMLPDLEFNQDWYSLDMPDRLADNVKSGYAKVYSWSYAKDHFFDIVDKAYHDRVIHKNKMMNDRHRMMSYIEIM
jgi:hypothetical protein